jgi:hypothetical protein
LQVGLVNVPPAPPSFHESVPFGVLLGAPLVSVTVPVKATDLAFVAETELGLIVKTAGRKTASAACPELERWPESPA